jgi:hypothetical protein
MIRIGDQTELTLKVNYNTHDGINSVKFPTLKDTIIGKVEIISKGEVEKYAPDKSNPSAIEQSQKFTITSFDSGYYAIPPFKFIINNDTTKIAETEAMLLNVNTVKADTTKAPKDIKPPLEEPFTFADALIYIYWGLGIVAVVTGIILLIIRLRKKPITLIPKAPPVPPHILAFGKLEELRGKKLWQEGKLKQYHSDLSDILREYIEHTFPLNAMELTTEEILHRFRRINIGKEIKSQLKQVLVLADMVKFAKEIPVAEENELSMQNAFAFVTATMPDENEKEKNEIEESEVKND